MIFLFEDKEGRPLPRLLQIGLRDYGRVEFAGGNKNLVNKVLDLKNLKEPLLVFLDFPFDRREFALLYRKLVKVVEKQDKVLIFPIICAEYCFLSAFYDIPIFRIRVPSKEHLLRECMIAGTCGSIEKECKHIVLHYLYSCATPSKGTLRDFYILDCLCLNPRSNCVPLNLKEKAKRYILEFPGLRLLKPGECVTWGELCAEYLKVIDEVNKGILKYNKLSDSDSFPILKYIPSIEGFVESAQEGRTSAFSNLY